MVKSFWKTRSQKTAVDIDNVKLVDRRGDNLLANGDFSRGYTYWFFSSFDHLNWHVKNIYVQLLFEQGWIGLLLFGVLAFSSVASLWFVANRGEIIFLLPLASLTALLTVGLFGSPLDTPRLDFLFYFTILAADLCITRSLSRGESAIPTQTAARESFREPSNQVESQDRIPEPRAASVQTGPITSDYSSPELADDAAMQTVSSNFQSNPVFASMLLKILG